MEPAELMELVLLLAEATVDVLGERKKRAQQTLGATSTPRSIDVAAVGGRYPEC
jgi:hypothetical protein